MVAGIVQACQVTPPLDVQGKKDGFNVVFNMNDLESGFLKELWGDLPRGK
jgi:hypothetical protein